MQSAFDSSFMDDAEDFLKDAPQASKLESAATSVTGGNDSYSEEETGWLGGIGADFRMLAVSVKETAGGLASFVHRSAINVANEIALLEEEGAVNSATMESLHLPWEIKNEEGLFEENDELKQLIMDVSKLESSFLEPFPTVDAHEEDDDPDFVLDDARVEIIRQLLKKDAQLSTMHARLSGRSDIREATFWRNYFHACSETRILFLAQELEHLKIDNDLDDNLEESSQTSANSLVPDDASYGEKDESYASKADDDSSFVCLSAGPGSVRSTGMKSIGSVVMVEQPKSTGSLLDFFS